MPKKFTAEQRKKMLDRLEYGATHTDVKSEFKIKDSRTLEKQLKIAREEQVLSLAKVDLIKESLRSHHTEIRSLLETWSATLKAPSPPSFARYPLSAADDLEQNRLFEGLRSHLPFPELWKNYKAFKQKWEEYITDCKEIHSQVLEKAKKKWGLMPLEKNEPRLGLTTSFSWETVDHAIKVALGDSQAETPHYVMTSFANAPEMIYLECGGRIILYGNVGEPYDDDHRLMISEVSRSERVFHLISLLEELRDLEKQLRDIVEETLLRRDYILYSCKLCPGGGQLAFK